MIALMRRLGERFYHFSGLREFKDKFSPEWRPRYFVAPAGYGSLRALADLAVLTSGGWRGVVSR
jgi:phosphatidylglycerol lysyltransferase